MRVGARCTLLLGSSQLVFGGETLIGCVQSPVQRTSVEQLTGCSLGLNVRELLVIREVQGGAVSMAEGMSLSIGWVVEGFVAQVTIKDP